MRELDALSSSTLKHLREQWWTDAFTEFLVETLRPRAGKRILDVGCGTGIAEVSLSRMRLSQVELFGVDLILDRVRAASEATRGVNAHVNYAAADASSLPFGNAVFDSTYCVAVLQHIRDVGAAVGELARVTREGGRLLIVEPDNAARYWFSSLPSGMEAFAMGQHFFTALALAGAESPPTQTGPLVPGLLRAHGIEAISVQLFPVTVSHLGPPEKRLWDARREAVAAAMAKAPDESLRRLGADYLKAIEQYARDAAGAGTSFVEIQNTMLFATVGQRADT
jgi:SAM-dependent methyltransferase